jgi:phosphoglycerol transferase
VPRLRFFLVFLSTLLVILPLWIRQTFGDTVTAEQLVFHVFSGIRGVAGARNVIYLSFILINILIPLAVAYGFNDLYRRVQARLTKNTPTSRQLAWFVSPLTTLVIAMMLFTSASHFTVSVGIPKYMESFYGPDTFSEAYANPKDMTFAKPAHPKNLLIIYVESLEYGFRREHIHGTNLIQAIDALPGQNAVIIPAPGTNWSIAGMVASLCSVPLKPYYHNDLGTKSRFLPSLTCLGDILAAQGYEQYFLTGPKLKFSGMDTFYLDHGYDVTIGRDEWKTRGLDISLFTGWGEGIHDDTLLKEAKTIWTKVREKNHPVSMTIITTDNHSPDGTTSPRCKDTEFREGYKHAFKCNSQYVAQFISDLDAAKLLDNTLVVIMGDHPFMNSPDLASTFPNPRQVYFKIMNAGRSIKRSSMTHFDVAPTILEDLGILTSKTGRFGLGISNFADAGESEFTSLFQKIIHDSITNHSGTYDSFWMPKI